MASRKPRKPKTLLEKVDVEYPGFAEEVLGLNVQQLDKRIADMQKELEKSEQHKAENQDLRDTSASLEQLRGPYKDVKKAVGLKTKFLVSLIREKGGA